MDELQQLRSFDQIKSLADARRLSILRLLMAGPATISQLGRVLKESPAWVRHHVKQLEAARLVEMVTEEVSEGFVEKYYQARAGAFLFQELILPELHHRQAIAIIGSHDLALEYLAQRMHQSSARIELINLPVGSLEGLVALRQGIAHMAGCHLWDAETGEYNLPFVKHFFPDRSMKIFTLAHREQGLLVTAGNPHRIQGLEDLLREDVTMINRNRGSGTRLWLERQLVSLELSTGHIHGYDREACTHTQVASEVRQGHAVTGLGILAAARRYSLDFIPIFQERFDLVLPDEQLRNPDILPILDFMQTKEFRRKIESMGGYDTSHTGDQWISN
jgi:putative molybdopterin biosynthesis protein